MNIARCQHVYFLGKRRLEQGTVGAKVALALNPAMIDFQHDLIPLVDLTLACPLYF